MSMAGFFQAVPANDIGAFAADHALIDAKLWGNREQNAVLAIDVETAWDVLNALVGEIGLGLGIFVENAMSNGCVLISAQTVQSQAQRMAHFTHEILLQKLEALSDDTDLYHFAVYQDDPDYLLEQFVKLQAFYQQAAAQNLGVVAYIA